MHSSQAQSYRIHLFRDPQQSEADACCCCELHGSVSDPWSSGNTSEVSIPVDQQQLVY